MVAPQPLVLETRSGLDFYFVRHAERELENSDSLDGSVSQNTTADGERSEIWVYIK
jgi:hypothetical protein